MTSEQEQICDYVEVEELIPSYTRIGCGCGRDKWVHEDDFYSLGGCPHDGSE